MGLAVADDGACWCFHQANLKLVPEFNTEEDTPPTQDVLHVLLARIAGMEQGSDKVFSSVGRREFAYRLDVPEALWMFDIDRI